MTEIMPPADVTTREYLTALRDSARAPEDLLVPLVDDDRTRLLVDAIESVPVGKYRELAAVLEAAARGMQPAGQRARYVTVLYESLFLPGRNATGLTDQPFGRDPLRVMLACGSSAFFHTTFHEYTHLATIVAFGNSEPIQGDPANYKDICEEALPWKHKNFIHWEKWMHAISADHHYETRLRAALNSVVENWNGYDREMQGAEMVPHFMDLILLLLDFGIEAKFEAVKEPVFIFDKLMTFVVEYFLPVLQA
jgi:hypothetical protein